MKKVAWLFVLLMWFVVPAVAQDTQNPPPNPPQDQESAPQDQNAPPAPAPAETPKPKAAPRYVSKYEISGGFAYRSYWIGSSPKIGMDGFYGSFERNWKTWLGFEAEGLGVYHRISSNQTESIYTFLVGPELFPLRHRKMTPFGHVLYGAGFYREVTTPFGGFGYNAPTALNAAWEAGGGVDLTVRKRWAVRLIEFDFGSTHFNTPILGGSTSQSSYRVSVGFVYRFGNR